MATTCAQYAEWLDAAEAALQALHATGQVQLVRYGEKEVRYHPKDASKLETYLNYLRRQLARCPGSARRRVLHIIPV